VHLVHVTDPHFGCEDVGAIKAVEKYIAETQPDAVIVTGDISIDGKVHELDAACNWMRALPVPAMCTPGNHDVPYYSLFGRLIDPFGGYRRAAHGIQTDPWHTPGYSIVPINTARGIQLRLNWAQGRIDTHQVDAACDELAKAAPGALKIIITHHPLDWPNDAPIHGATINGQAAIERLVLCGADMFLSGHLHFASARLIASKALSVTSGTLSKRVRHEPCAFTVLRRPEPRVIQTEVMHIRNGVVEMASCRKFQLTPYADAVPTDRIHATT
jgi:3',5'-cyclic AMP phosphodiesterase CpdA